MAEPLVFQIDSSQARSGLLALEALERQARSLEGAAGALGAAFGAVISFEAIRRVAQFTEAHNLLVQQIRNATAETRTFAAAYDSLFQSAQKAGTSFEANVRLFQRLSFVRTEITATQNDVLKFVDSIAKIGVVGGQSAEETAASIKQLAQALGSGKLQGDELRSILENNGKLAKILADNLGVGVGQLKEMGERGELTSRRVFRALLNGADQINKEFEKAPMTMGRGWQSLSDATGQFLSRLDEVLGVTQAVGREFAEIAKIVRAITPGGPSAEAGGGLIGMGQSALAAASQFLGAGGIREATRSRTTAERIAAGEARLDRLIDNRSGNTDPSRAAEFDRAIQNEINRIQEDRLRLMDEEETKRKIGIRDAHERLDLEDKANRAMQARVDKELQGIRAQAEGAKIIAGAAGGSPEARAAAAARAAGLRAGATPREGMTAEELKLYGAGVEAATLDIGAAERSGAVARETRALQLRVQAEKEAAEAAKRGGAASKEAAIQAQARALADTTSSGAVSAYAKALREVAEYEERRNITEALDEAVQQAKATERLAEAAKDGAAAVEKQEIKERALAEAIRLVGRDSERLHEVEAALLSVYEEQDIAQRAKDLALWNEQQRVAIDETNRLAEAELKGAAAVAETSRQLAIEAEIRRRRVDPNSPEAAGISASISDRAQAGTRRDFNRAVRGSQNELQLAQAELAVANQLPEVRRRELNILQAKLRIEEEYATLLPEQRQALLDNVIALEQVNEQIARQEREAEQWQEPWKNALEGIQGAFTNFFEQAFRGGINSFKDLAGGIKDIFIRLAAELATLMVIRPILGPIAGAFGIPGFGGMGGGGFGMPAGQLASSFTGGAGGGGGWGSPGWAGSSAPWINPDTGAPMPAAGGGFGFMNILGSGAIGAGIGSIIPSLTGRTGPGRMIGGALGGIAGGAIGGMAAGAALGSIVPGIGTLIGAVGGSLLGGLFGPKKSVGPNAGANVFIGGSGAVLGGAGGDNGGNVSEAIAFAQGYADLLNGLRSNYGINFAGETQAQFGSMKGQLFAGYGGGYERSIYRGSDSNAAYLAVLNRMASEGRFAGGGTSGQILSRGNFGSVEDLTKALDFGKVYDELIKVTTAKGPFASALDDLTKKFREAMESASKYGLGLGELAAAQERATAALRDDFNKQIRYGILDIEDPMGAALARWEDERQEALKEATAIGGDLAAVEKLYGLKRKQILEEANEDALRSIRGFKGTLRDMLNTLTGGPMNPAAPGQQYQGALASFNAAAAQISANPGMAPGNIGEIIENFLNASRTNFGSGPVYAANYDRATNLLRGLLGEGAQTSTTSAAALQTVQQLQASNLTLAALLAEIQALRAELVAANNRILALTAANIQPGSRAA